MNTSQYLTTHMLILWTHKLQLYIQILKAPDKKLRQYHDCNIPSIYIYIKFWQTNYPLIHSVGS